jgi:hypothetical protein
MKKLVEGFLIFMAVLALPPIVKDYMPEYYRRHAGQTLICALLLAAFITVINGVRVDEANRIPYWVKHRLFTIRNITIFLFCAIVVEVISVAIVFPSLKIEVSYNSVIVSSTIGICYILLLLISDQVPFDQRYHSTIYYNGTRVKMAGFHGTNGGLYDHNLKKEVPPYSTGTSNANGSDLIINRTNIDGRFKLILIQYLYRHTTLDHIPVDPLITVNRILEISCEVCSPQGVRHVLVFAFADAVNHNWFQSSGVEVVSSSWQQINISLSASADSKLKLRIDDIEVGAPSSLMIKNLKISEKL